MKNTRKGIRQIISLKPQSFRAPTKISIKITLNLLRENLLLMLLKTSLIC